MWRRVRQVQLRRICAEQVRGKSTWTRQPLVTDRHPWVQLKPLETYGWAICTEYAAWKCLKGPERGAEPRDSVPPLRRFSPSLHFRTRQFSVVGLGAIILPRKEAKMSLGRSADFQSDLSMHAPVRCMHLREVKTCGVMHA
jgi:hypothetical protein